MHPIAFQESKEQPAECVCVDYMSLSLLATCGPLEDPHVEAEGSHLTPASQQEGPRSPSLHPHLQPQLLLPPSFRDFKGTRALEAEVASVGICPLLSLAVRGHGALPLGHTDGAAPLDSGPAPFQPGEPEEQTAGRWLGLQPVWPAHSQGRSKSKPSWPLLPTEKERRSILLEKSHAFFP